MRLTVLEWAVVVSVPLLFVALVIVVLDATELMRRWFGDAPADDEWLPPTDPRRTP